MEEKINLPFALGLAVWDELKKKHNIEPRQTKFGLLDFNFTAEELSLITSLKFINPTATTIQGISLLPNLKTLEIRSTEISSHKASKDLSSIDDRGAKEIAKCTSLESLSVINQGKLDYLDVSKLTRLQSLTITHNQRLDEIDGLENLHDLWGLDIFGNNRIRTISGLDKVVLQNPELFELNLDVLMFPEVIGFKPATGEYNEAILDKIKEIADSGKVNWCESLNGNRKIRISTSQMISMHNKACQILAENVPEYAGARDVIVGIEDYIARNIVYDREAAKGGHSHTSPMGNVKLVSGPKFGANGAYNALMQNTCVCEGYTRAMQYLLALKGIKSHNVDCFAGKDVTGMAYGKGENEYTVYNLPQMSEYHSIICIDDYECLYDDPCWNAVHYQAGDKSMPWVLLTKDEISKDHTLSFDERIIDNPYSSQPRNAIKDSIARNELFRKTRTSSVMKSKNALGQQFKGQIVQRGGPEK